MIDSIYSNSALVVKIDEDTSSGYMWLKAEGRGIPEELGRTFINTSNFVRFESMCVKTESAHSK